MTTENTPGRPAGETDESRIAKALAHPLRARILQRLGERVLSPGDLAEELGAPLGVVSYHVRMLRDYECIELVRTEPRRGALQHFYRAIARASLDREQLKSLPLALRGELVGEVLGELVDGAAAALGDPQAEDVSAASLWVELDEKGLAMADRRVLKLMEDLRQLAEAAGQRETSKVRVCFGALTFQQAKTGEAQ